MVIGGPYEVITMGFLHSKGKNLPVLRDVSVRRRIRIPRTGFGAAIHSLMKRIGRSPLFRKGGKALLIGLTLVLGALVALREELPSTKRNTLQAVVTDSRKTVEYTTRVVNINTASLEELMSVKGIGQKRAEAILAWRKEHGRFNEKEEIMQVKGIKKGIYGKIKNAITVEDAE